MVNFDDDNKSSNKIERVPSGIPGLDDLIEGGFPKNDSFLISGTPGTAKTTFGLQYIINGAIKYNQKGLFIAVEEPVSLLRKRFARLGWDLDKLQRKGLIAVDNPDINVDEGEDFMEHLTSKNYIGKIRDFGAERLVLDSLSLVMSFSTGFGGFRRGTQKLAEIYRDLGITSLLMEERFEPIEKSRFSMEHFMIDGLIYLEMIQSAGIIEKTINIYKMRGTNHGRRFYPMQIRDQGLIVFPDQHVI
jgi:KaiC/GvpD/RAD55 family RecA-like ATPase